MAEKENSELRKQLSSKQQEAADIKKRLDDVNTEKEAWFQKRKTFSQKINSLLSEVRDSRSKRNTFTKQVKSSKERRNQLNTEIKQKVEELKKLQKEKVEVAKKSGIRIDPAKIKAEIEELEFKVETAALPFSVEQRIMKDIAEKRKVLNQSKEVSDVFDNIHKLNKEVKKLREKADEAHKKIQTKAGESQEQHESFIESSKGIDELRNQEEEALKKFVEWKGKHTAIADELRAKQSEIREIKNKLDGVKEVKRVKQKRADDKKLKEQEMSVEEKIKKGEKLTTEDLLVFQAQSQITVKKKKR